MKKKLRNLIPGFPDFFILLCVYHLITAELKDIATDPGTGWHIKTGEWILSNLKIPYTDPFLADNRKWVSDQWGTDIIFSLLYQYGSWPLLYTFILLFFIFIFFGILQRYLHSVSKMPLISTLITLLVFKVAQIHFLIRPVIVSFFFFTLLACSLHYIQSQGKHSRKVLLGTPIAFFLWSNLHPSFALGLVLYALFFICSIPQYISARKVDYTLTLCFIGSIFATLINPYGIALHFSILELGKSDFFMNLHQEWKSPDFKKLEGLIFEVLVFLLAIFYAQKKKYQISDIFWVSSLLFFAHLSLKSVRVIPFFAIVSSFPLNSFLAESLKRYKSKPLLRVLYRLETSLYTKTSNGLIALICITFYSLSQVITTNSIPLYKGTYGPPPEKYPYNAVAFINDISDKEIRLYAPPSWGGFIALFGEENIKPLIDDRNTLVGEDFYKDYLSSKKSTKSLKDFLRRAKTHYVLIRSQGILAEILKYDNEFFMLREFKVGSVFEYRFDQERTE